MTAIEAQADPDREPGAAFEDSAARVDRAIAALADVDVGARERAFEVKAAIEAFHRSGLVHLVRTLRADQRGAELLYELVEDPTVRALFALHGIIRTPPADLATRAEQALDTVRPYLQSHGGDVELVRINGAIAVVTLHGSCNGCSMSAVTLRDGVEEALVGGVDGIDGIEVLQDTPTAAFIPLSAVGRRTDGRTMSEQGWAKGPQISSVAGQTMVRFDLDDDTSFVVTNIDHRFAVFRNVCAHQGMSLDGGLLDDGVIVCPWHGMRFDASSGECLSAPGAQLEQVPTRIVDGHLWVRPDGS